MRVLSRLLLVIALCSFSFDGFAQSKVEEGLIDLSSINFEQTNPISLEGEWKFFWGKLLDPSNTDSVTFTFIDFATPWSDNNFRPAKGFATYSATILLPNEYPALALDIPDFYSSYRLYLNGKEIANNGKPAISKSSYIPQWLPKTVALGELSSDTLQLVLHVANFDHRKGGAYLPIKFGSAEELFASKYLDYGYSFVLTGALLMGGLFFFGLYLFGRHETTILYFSLFCIIYSYRVIGFGLYPLHFLLPEIPWIVTLKLEYITLFLSGYLFGIYTLNLYPKETSKPLIYILSSVSLLFIAISLLLPASIFTNLVAPYFVILICYIIYAFWVYTRAVMNKNLGAGFALASTGVVFIVFLYQMMVYFAVFESFLLLNFAGYIFFFFFQSLVLSYRFAESLKMALRTAEESSRAKSQFLSTMSHEIRTPLNAVIGLSGLLSDSDLDLKQKEFSQTIKKSGESLLSIINNILDFSKIESGKLDLEEREFNLPELVENVFDLVSSLTDKPNLELTYLIDSNVPEYIIGDSTRLSQILVNLVANAIKFTEKGEVSVRITPSSIQDEIISLNFSVKDTGIGIPKERMDRLFKSFSQVDASSTRKYGGTGLGLVISKRLVDAMNGTMRVESIPNKGSEFSFNIHFGISNRKGDANKESILSGKKVFVLDDNRTNLNIVNKQLTKFGLEVDTFDSPVEVLGMINQLEKYDFGILDMQMPTFDGIEVATKIRTKWNHKDLPLILLSSIHELENKEQKKLFELYLTKPIKQTQLVNNLERIFINTSTKNRDKSGENIPEEVDQTRISILIAEDNLINQKVALKILERLNLKADVADNGEIALQMVQEKDYDLVFMDMEMPIMDGIESTKKIRAIQHSLSSELRIIAMTANALMGDREKCIEAGMDDFISKPITVESMKTILKKWFTVF